MRIMLIEPQGKYPGHPSAFLSSLTRALTTKHHITLVSYNGLLEDRLPPSVDHFVVSQKSGLVNLINRILPLPNTLFYKHIYDSVATFLTIIYARILLRYTLYDVFHFVNGDILCVLLFGNILSKKLFMSLHHVVPVVVRDRKKDYKWYKSLLITILNAFVDLLLKGRIHRNSFICHSQENLNAYKSTGYFDDMRHIPWAINAPHTHKMKTFREESDLTEKVFLIFGLNHVGKCYELVFKVFSELDFRDFRLLFVGKVFYKNANNPYLLSGKYDLDGNTIVIDDYVPEEDIPKYFLSADAVLIPYSKTFLGASGALSHSLEYQVPVIASDVGQIGKWVSQNKLGTTFLPEDAESFKKAVECYLSMSDSEIEEIKRNIRSFSEKFGWARIADAYITYYKHEKVQPFEDN